MSTVRWRGTSERPWLDRTSGSVVEELRCTAPKSSTFPSPDNTCSSTNSNTNRSPLVLSELKYIRTYIHTRSAHLDLCLFRLSLQDDISLGGGLAGQEGAGLNTKDGLVCPSHLWNKAHLCGGDGGECA